MQEEPASDIVPTVIITICQQDELPQCDWRNEEANALNTAISSTSECGRNHLNIGEILAVPQNGKDLLEQHSPQPAEYSSM